jgi:hypothetical protein
MESPNAPNGCTGHLVLYSDLLLYKTKSKQATHARFITISGS